MSKSRTFRCELCEVNYPVEPGWTDDMAKEEFRRLYPDQPFENVAKICDDCHKMVEIWRQENEEKRTLQ